MYRGKRKDNGEWIEGSLLKVTISGETYYFIFCDEFALDGFDVKALSRAIVDPETIGEYSGLLDKNGKRIFEGDIIRVGRSYMFDDDDCKAEIGVGIVTLGIGTFDMGFYRYLGWHCKKSDGDVDSYPIVDCDEDWISEVIGPIHDNPELLEASGDE